jgi:hypothetical protein
LTEKQERFAAELAIGSTYAQAYRTAYPTSLKWPDKDVWSKASNTAADGRIKTRVAELRAPAVALAQYDVSQAMVETDRYLTMAAKDRAWGPVSAMLTHKAKLNALLLMKVEVGGVGEFQKFNAQEKLTVMEALQVELAKRKALVNDVQDVSDKLDAGE